MLPIDHFQAVAARCDQIAGLYAFLSSNTTSALQPDELLRAEWVLRISALDLYVHELVAQRMLAIFDGSLTAPQGFLRFQLPNEALLRVKNATSQVEASLAFDLHVRTQLSRVTYQFPEDIAAGIRLCSDVELWNEIALHQGSTPQSQTNDAKALKQSLSLLVRRRNAIAHEGDLQQGPVRTVYPILQADLQLVRSFVKNLVSSINAVVT